MIAKGGDPSPDGTGTLGLIEIPIVMGASGQVAFRSEIRDQGGFLAGFGIFRCSSATDLTLIARFSASVTGWPAPDGNGYLSGFPPPTAINGSGQVAFAARLTQAFPQTEHGLFVGSGGQAGLVQIARENELVPGFIDRISDLPGIPSLNDAGEVAFYAGFGTGNPFGQAILRGDGTPGSLVEIARRGQPTPDGTATLFSFETAAPLNDAGEAAFGAGPGGGPGGIFRGSGGELTEIARGGEASPDGNGSLLPPARPALNDSGDAAFFTVLTGTTGGSSDNEGIFKGDGTNLAVIARRGDLTPGGNGRLLNIESGGLAFNDLGQVLFASTITGAQNGSSEGVFRGDGGSLLAIARVGDPAPGGPGVFSKFEPLALNDKGQAVFKAFIDLGNGGDPKDTEGLFFFDDVQGLVEVARIGDVVPGAGVVAAFIFAGGNSGMGMGTSGLNAQGDMAYFLAAGDSLFVVSVPEPVPEPGAAGLTMAAGVALLLLGRRARRSRRTSG